jgi:CubicO group peptidase (beta-lactamase class C family)
LAEKGQLDLDAGVRKYVPEFPDKGVKITARQLLDHQSGIPHYSNGKIIATKAAYKTPHPFTDPVVSLDHFKESPLLFKPGEKYSYSSYGYLLLSAVVERAGKQKFADQIRNRIAQPLDLTTLQPDFPWVSISNRAAGYRLDNGKVLLSSDTDQSWKWGGGAYISTIGDFTGFAEGLLNSKLVNKETETKMWTPQPTSDGKPTDYGLGFEVVMKDGVLEKVFHEGKQEKTRTRYVIYPAKNNAVVVMTNSEWVNPGKFSTLVYGALAKK